MYNKVSPVIIIIIAVAIILVFLLGFGLIIRSRNSNHNTVKEVTDIEPTLELNLSTEEAGQDSVVISAIAATEDLDGVYSITLPDGSVSRTDIVEYEVTENGNYTFKATGNNGKSTSLAIEVNNIRVKSSSEPYIPQGFSHIEGEVEEGYVIEDSYGNQYVWVPVESGKLTRNTKLDTKYEESNSSVSEFVNSVAQNYGFYMGRYEASSYSIGNASVAASMRDKAPWTNISYASAASVATESAASFGYEDCQTSLMNSYAWDTTLSWIDMSVENYSSSISYGNYSGSMRSTGSTESDRQKNIFDLAGNVREWTTEIFKENTTSTQYNSRTNTVEDVLETVNYRVIRGGSANLDRPASSHTGYKDNSSEAYWGFRMILYK